jgi:hypothetical protein
MDGFVARQQRECRSYRSKGLIEFDIERSKDIGFLKECIELRLGWIFISK